MATTGVEAFPCTGGVRNQLWFVNSIPAAEHHLHHQIEQLSHKASAQYNWGCHGNAQMNCGMG